MARADSGEVLLTTCIGEILGDVVFSVMSGDATLDEFVTKPELAQLGEFRCLAKAEYFPLIEGTGKFDQKAGLTLWLGDTQCPPDFIGNFEGH
jgi:hypothetical protein